jgi:hypothetical protein
MTEISFHALRQSRFIHRTLYENESEKGPRGIPTWDAKPQYKKLVENFVRNKVLMEFNATNSSSEIRDSDEFKDIEKKIHEFCDKNCTGMWTMNHTVSSGDYWDNTNSMMVRTGSCTGAFYIHFENEADIAGFLKDCAVVLKLTY